MLPGILSLWMFWPKYWSSRDRDIFVAGATATKISADVQTGLMLRIIDNKAFLTAKPKLKEIVSRLYRPQNRPALSQASYETLAAIAYNQPCTRAQVEEIRGVNSDGIISRLLERNLIQEVGTLDLPGNLRFLPSRIIF